MIRRYYKASATAKIAHIGPVWTSALDRTVCGHIIVTPQWVSLGVLADNSPARAQLEVCRSCDRMKDADTMTTHRAPEGQGSR